MKKLFLLISVFSIGLAANAQVPQTDDDIIAELTKQGMQPSDIRVRMLEKKHREELHPMYESINKLSDNEKKLMNNFMKNVIDRSENAKARQGVEAKATDGKLLGELMDDEYDSSVYIPLAPLTPPEEKEETAAEDEQ